MFYYFLLCIVARLGRLTVRLTLKRIDIIFFGFLFESKPYGIASNGLYRSETWYWCKQKNSLSFEARETFFQPHLMTIRFSRRRNVLDIILVLFGNFQESCNKCSKLRKMGNRRIIRTSGKSKERNAKKKKQQFTHQGDITIIFLGRI